MRFVDRQCLTARTRHETERHWRTGNHQESRLIIKPKKIHIRYMAESFDQGKTILQYENDFIGF